MSGEPPRKPTPLPPRAPEPRVILSDDLLQGAREVLIIHAGQVYRLRLTRHGKLILTK